MGAMPRLQPLLLALLGLTGVPAIVTGAGPAPAAACTDDEGCELNGECIAGSCRCQPQWHGPTCGQLTLLPTSRSSGFRGGGDGKLQHAAFADNPTSTWGGSIVGPDANATWHMFVSEMSLGCGLTSWKSNSQIVVRSTKSLRLNRRIFWRQKGGGV